MSTNTLSYEGLTLKVIIQKGDLTYHGVPIQTTGSGTLYQFMKSIMNSTNSQDSKKSYTTSSQVLQQIPMNEFGVRGESISRLLRDTRNLVISQYSDLQRRCKDFFNAVEGAKAAALGNKEMKYLSSSDMEKLKNVIQPYCVGPILIVKIQARMFSKEAFPGAKALRDGGYSINRVLYKFYLPMMEFEEAHAVIQRAMEECGQNKGLIQSQTYKNIIRKEVNSNGKETITIKSQPPMPTVRDKQTGKYNPIDVLRQDSRVRDKLAKMDLGI